MERLRVAYMRRVELYDRELASILGVLPPEEGGRPSRYPELPITLDPESPETEETLVVDTNLFTNLFDIYLVHGWAGIRHIENQLTARARPDEGAPYGGTVVSVWRPAWTFFAFTRNLLAVLVRNALIEIERLAATRIVGQISTGAAALARAWQSEFKISRNVRYEERSVYDKDGIEVGEPHLIEVSTYAFGDQNLSATLYKALTDAITQRVEYEALLERIEDLRAEIQHTKRHIEHQRQPRVKQHYREKLTSMASNEKQLSDLEAATREFFNAMRVVIHMNCPLALLVLDGLKPGFKQSEMEQLIGETLWQLYSRIDTLGLGIDPQRSRAAEVLPGIQSEEQVEVALERLRIARDWDGPEVTLIDVAIKRLPKEPAYFALLNEATLNLLVESGEIERDSLAFAVFCHYDLALIDRMEAERQREEATVAFWKAFGQAAAAASLASLVTPAAGLAPLLRGASAIAGLVLLAHNVSSVVQSLALLDQLVAERLIEPNAFALESLSRLTELAAFRKDLLQNMPEQLLAELLLIAVGARWVPLKKLLVMRGYLMDLEVLFGNG